MTKARDTGEVLNTRGTAATADVQTSPTDATAGRVLTTGAGGWLAPSSDIVISSFDDTSPETSILSTTSSTAGTKPPASIGGGYGTLVILKYSSASIDQVWYNVSSSAPEIFSRRYASSTWSAWQPVYTGGNYQPYVAWGVGVTRLLKNKSGGIHNNGQTGILGSALGGMYVDGADNGTKDSGATPSGLYTCVQGSGISNNNGGWYTRES